MENITWDNNDQVQSRNIDIKRLLIPLYMIFTLSVHSFNVCEQVDSDQI